MTDPTGPTMTDHLARRVAASPEDTSAVKHLWEETFHLQRWWFVPTGDSGQWAPATAPVHGQNMLLGFTTRDRAVDFAEVQGFVADESVIDLLALAPTDVIAHLDSYQAAGVQALIMDADTTGYFAPLEHLPKMWSQLHGDPLARDDKHDGADDDDEDDT